MVEEVDLPTLAAGRLLAVAVAQAVAQWVEIAELLLDSATVGRLVEVVENLWEARPVAEMPMDWDWGMVDLDPLLKIKVAHRDGGRQPVCLLCLSFALNFLCWGAEEIQLLNSKIKIDSSGEPRGTKVEPDNPRRASVFG